MKLIQTHQSSIFKAIGFLIFLFTSNSVLALTTLTVTVSSDNNPGGIGEMGDLRYVLNSMNQDLNMTSDDYAIVFASPMTIQLNGILPIINNSSNPVNITIGNPGATPTVTIDGNSGAYSGFFIPMGNVTIQNMIFQNMSAKGGKGGNGISGGGGGMGAGGAIYAPQSFLNGSNPSVTLMNVSINNSSAVGGNGGNYFALFSTGNEGGGGGGGFSGNGGSITTTGSTGGAGGGGFGGNGGDVTLPFELQGGGGGGGGGLGSRASIGMLTNLGDGGSDQNFGLNGNGYGLTITAGSGGGGNSGGNNAGGGGGGGAVGMTLSGGGGGGSAGSNGLQPQGSIPPLVAGLTVPSGGNGGDGAGGGGGGIVTTAPTNDVDGQSGGGGYGGGGGGGAGTGAYDVDYTVQGGSGGLGGGGGGGGVDQSGMTPAEGGNSLGGGGGAGGGPSNGPTASGGTDVGNLGGGSGGAGANTYGSGFGGGGGGGGSGLGAAIFVDTSLNFTIQAFSGVPTTFNTPNNTTQAGTHGTGGPGGSDGTDGTALGNSIFLRTGSSLTFMAQDAGDVLTLGDQVAFTDDTIFGAGGTSVFVKGNGSVIYQGTTDYQGTVTVNNANFKVNGQIDQAPVLVCRNVGFSSQRGILSGIGTLTGNIFANSGTIYPDTGGTLTLGSLTLNSADIGTLGSLVHIDINSNGTSLVAVTGSASLAGILEINIDPSAQLGNYTLLTSSGITGTFDSVTFTGVTPTNYSLSYLPTGAPTYVQLNIVSFTSPPVVTTSGGTTSWTESNNLTVISTPVVINSGVTVSDSDSPTLSSGTVSITVGFQSSEDVLAFTNNPATMGNISASYTSGTGVLALSSSGATATLAQWQAALRAITYNNTAQPPTGSSRTISFVVNDGTANSATATKTISLTTVNHPPIFTLGSDVSWPVSTSGLKTAANFATLTSFGQSGESGQAVLAWQVTDSTDPGGVVSGIQIQPNGTLLYALTGQSGTATISVQCQDNGSTANGGNDTSAIQTFHITVDAGWNLSISMDDHTRGKNFFGGGDLAHYTIVVQNIGTSDVHNAVVQDTLPSNLLGASWTCEALGASTCTPSGTGNISDTVTIPKNSAVIYRLTATVQADPELPVVNTATVTLENGEVDVTTNNNTASLTDEVGIFRDGFESLSGPLGFNIIVTANAAQTQVLTLDVPYAALTMQPRRVARGASP